MNKAYERINWKNYPSEETALNESNLNKMDAALNEVDNRVVVHETTKLDKATANSMVKDVDFNETTGIFTITFLNGVTKTLDTKLEKIATNFRYDYATQKIILTLVDGTTQEIDMSTLITQYEFADSSYIKWTIMSDGKIKAEIINGSITADKLQPNFLADVTLQANSAKTSEQNAKVSEENAKQSEINAKNYADSAEPVASTANSLNPTLDNSTGAPIISFKGDGATEQQTYSGKNLFEITASTETKNGITSTVNSDKSVTFSGAYASMTYFLLGAKTLKAGTYKISGCPSGGGYESYTLRALIQEGDVGLATDFGSGATLTLEEDTDVRMSIYAYSNDIIGKTFYPMIRLASVEDATYEPYVGGIASPNPDYPQEINGLAKDGAIEVKTCGKNIFTEKAEEFSISGSYSVWKIDNYEKELTLSIKSKNDDTSLGLGELYFGWINDPRNPSENEYTWLLGRGEIAQETSTSSNGKRKYLFAYPYTELQTILSVLNIQLEEGATATPYEPYTETTATIPLSAPLYEGDYIRYNMDGTGELVRYMKKITIDGTNVKLTGSDNFSPTGYNYSYLWADDMALPNSMLLSSIGQGGYLNKEGIYSNGTIPIIMVILADERVGTLSTDSASGRVEKFNAWLAENPITVVYELKEPEVTPLTAEQIAEFEKLRTFDGVTHVTCEGESEVQYFYDSVGGKSVAMVASKANTSAELPIGSVIMIEEQNTEKPKYGEWSYLFTQTLTGESGGTPRAVSVNVYQRRK